MFHLELGDDTNGLVSMIHVDSSDENFIDNGNAFGIEMSSNYDVDVNVEVFEVTKADFNTNLAKHIELMDDHIPMATFSSFTTYTNKVHLPFR